MDTQNKAARLGAAMQYTHANYKPFPAYGKKLMQLRQAGQIPRNNVIVTFDWELGRAFTRVIITDRTPLGNLDFRYLAGLDCIIVYQDKDAPRINELAQVILNNNPRCLQAFAIDIPATTLIKLTTGEVRL